MHTPPYSKGDEAAGGPELPELPCKLPFAPVLENKLGPLEVDGEELGWWGSATVPPDIPQKTTKAVLKAQPKYIQKKVQEQVQTAKGGPAHEVEKTGLSENPQAVLKSEAFQEALNSCLSKYAGDLDVAWSAAQGLLTELGLDASELFTPTVKAAVQAQIKKVQP